MTISHGQEAAVYYTVKLCLAIDDHDLTIADLEEAWRELLEDGHDRAKTCLYMMQAAVVLAQPKTEDEPNDTGAGE